MADRLINREEAEMLVNALRKEGEMRFPLGWFVTAYLCGTIYRIQKKPNPYKLKLRDRIIARISNGYASVLAFALWLGPENVKVSPEIIEGSLKIQLRMTLKSNHSLKCNPLGPDVAALRHII